MDSKVKATIIITVVFVIAVAVLQYMHMHIDTDLSEVPAEYLQPYDVTMPLDFIDELESRVGNEVGPDLEY